MHLEFLLEEPSATEALRILLPKIIGAQATYDIHPFQGKTDLLGKLPRRLRGYKHWQGDLRVLLLIDRDDQDCRQLKAQLEAIAHSTGVATKSAPAPDGRFLVINRIVVRELEAWFFGDVAALVTAYPRLSRKKLSKAKYRDPDAISDTWEALEKVLQEVGEHLGGLEKIRAAREIAAHMDPQRNRSASFCLFRDTLLELVNPALNPATE